MRAIDTVYFVIWIAFWVYWLAAAFTAKATRSRSRASVSIRLAIFVVVFLAIRLHPFHENGTIRNPALEGIGLALVVTGLGLAVWARIYLGRNWGTPMSQRVDPELVTTGPYRYVRHPIYSGILLAGLGTGIGVDLFWFALVAVMGAYFIFSATVEEQNMGRQFPAQYPAYKRLTKMLIPFVF